MVQRYRAGTGTVTFQKLEPEPEIVRSQNRNRKKWLRFRNTAKLYMLEKNSQIKNARFLLVHTDDG
jgi:hypothetical protein